MRAIHRSWPRIAVGLTAAGILMAGCGGGGGGGSATGEVTAPPVTGGPGQSPAPNPPGNQAPTISGTPQVGILVGQAYTFQPEATDVDNDPITFSIANKPDWATFDPATGRLSGTPTAANIGVHEGIEIGASDGTARTALPKFAVVVSAQGSSVASVTLGWTPPTENDDGTPLNDLAGFRIHYGNASQDYSGTIAVDDPARRDFLVHNLPEGTYYFAITAVNSEGLESVFSTEVNAEL